MGKLAVHRPSERGQGMLEYILIVVFVAVAGIGVWRVFGQNILALLKKANSSLVDQAAKAGFEDGSGLPVIE